MNSKKCNECDKFLDNEKKCFCNRSCAAKYNNRKYPKKNKKKRICKNCGKSINKYVNDYCDISCYQEYEFKYKTLPKFYNGEISNNITIRKILIYLSNAKCTECGNDDTWNGKSLVLEVDHINGNSDNNKPENLRLLCPNCHSQQNTSKGTGTIKKETKRNKYLRKYKNSLLV